jgi:hypothetical protein
MQRVQAIPERLIGVRIEGAVAVEGEADRGVPRPGRRPPWDSPQSLLAVGTKEPCAVDRVEAEPVQRRGDQPFCLRLCPRFQGHGATIPCVLDRAQGRLVGCVDAARKKFLYILKAGPAGGRLRRPPSGPAATCAQPADRRAADSSTVVSVLRACYESRCGD